MRTALIRFAQYRCVLHRNSTSFQPLSGGFSWAEFQMCSSCGGICHGSASRSRGRTSIDVNYKGRNVFSTDRRKARDRSVHRTRMCDASAISGKLEDTPEGFLVCRDVPLARTGEQIYLSHEVNVPPLNGRVIAERNEDQVFHPDAIASFRGKPLTDDHPYDDVSPANYKQHLIGVVQSPRRGTGVHSHCVVGDLMVYDPDAIRKIKAGIKRELSCGYDADYEIISPGRARQINIRGNHVSLVDEGRCGPTCAIRDKRN